MKKSIYIIGFLAIIAIFAAGSVNENTFQARTTKAIKSVSTKVKVATNLAEADRISDSLNKPVSDHEVKKCTRIKHIDGAIVAFCLAKFNGSTGAYYDTEKKLMVVGSFNESTLLHEITHASTYYFYSIGKTNFLDAATQEELAYNSEYLLKQIRDFERNYAYIEDLDLSDKAKLGFK